MNPFYQVVILSFNHPEITRRCIQSVLDLGFPAERIILVHNGSEKNFVQFLQKKCPADIQHLILPQNLGFTGGANAGLSEGFKKSDWVYFLTNDTEALHLPIDKPKESALIAPLVYRRKTSVVASRMGFFDPKWGELRHLKSSQDFMDLPLRGFLYTPGTAFLMSRDIFEATGGFDESLHTYWEDVDLSVRVQKSGFQVKHDPQISLVHFVGKTCHKKSFYTTYLYHRNKQIVSLRYVQRKDQIYFYLSCMKDFSYYALRFLLARRFQDLWLLIKSYVLKEKFV